jgi:arylsulfatase A-like enzyme
MPRSMRSLRMLWLALLVASCAKPAKPARPSVILVSIDTLRADHVGLYGYARPTTPFLDRWAQGGVVFERAFTTAAWTLVAHMTMLTGLFPEQHGVIGKNRALSPEIPLLAERMRAAGYRTYGLYFDGWINARHGFDRGFDVFESHKDLAEADAHLRKLLPELERGGPFFLFLHLFDVHCGDLDHDTLPYQEPEPYQSRFLAGLPPLPKMPLRKLWESENLLTSEQLQTVTALYDSGIQHVDEQLGRWFGEFEQRGLTRNTLMIVTADHGEALGEHGRLNQHGDSWQSALHIPLILRHPAGLGAGTRVSTPVHLGDVVPTILAAAGLAPDPLLPGVSLLGPIPAERVIYGVKLPEAFVLKWPEKLVFDLGTRSYRAVDLVRDPEEHAPTKGDAQRFDTLKTEALAPGHAFPKAGMIELDEAARAKLEALGYGGESDKPEKSDAGGEHPAKPATEKPR